MLFRTGLCCLPTLTDTRGQQITQNTTATYCVEPMESKCMCFLSLLVWVSSVCTDGSLCCIRIVNAHSNRKEWLLCVMEVCVATKCYILFIFRQKIHTAQHIQLPITWMTPTVCFLSASFKEWICVHYTFFSFLQMDAFVRLQIVLLVNCTFQSI